MERQRKNARILELFEELCAGKTVNKSEAAVRFGVDERSIQRDIDDIRAFFREQSVFGAGESREVVYCREEKGFVLRGSKASPMTNSEILIASKILLESRALPRKEMSLLLDKLVAGCVPRANQKLVSDLIANEKFHYVELTQPPAIQDKLWTMGVAIRESRALELTYQRQDQNEPPVTRLVEPVSLLFSEYYFYLNAYIAQADNRGRLERTYDYPAVFRVDRVLTIRPRGEKFQLPYSNRFQEGEFRKRVQFMYPGELMQVVFRYSGASVESILDRLPTAKIRRQDERGWELQAEVYGKGILMWLLSQGEQIEVLSPASLRQEMIRTLEEMLAKYR